MSEKMLTTYDDNSMKYAERLPRVLEKISTADPEKVGLITTPVTPYSISIVAGIPLFRTHDHQRDYNAVVHDLREVLPGQFPYDNLRTHIALGVLIRNSPGSRTDNGYTPVGDKREFYKNYLDVFNSIKFDPFSLRLQSFHPPGILIWQPEGNPDQVFDVRRQIRQGLIDKKQTNPNISFETKDDGEPNTDTGLIHSSFIRFADRDKLVQNWNRYLETLIQVNEGIRSGALFSEPLKVAEIAFIEPRVSREISVRDWYTDEIISRRKA